jgi:hypothetical protein
LDLAKRGVAVCFGIQRCLTGDGADPSGQQRIQVVGIGELRARRAWKVRVVEQSGGRIVRGIRK